MKPFKKNKSLQIEYFTEEIGLLEIDQVLPKPLKNFIPEWWKNIPSSAGDKRTVKHCPSFTDIFSSAYVVPMWCDTIITIEENITYWKTPTNIYQNEFHSYDQFLQYAPNWINKNVKSVLKPISPWFAKTPPGYSIYQMPVFYDFNEDFCAMPGIIHTDVYNIINPQLLIYSDKKEFLIKRGTPLFVHFPFKRDRFKILSRQINDNDILDLKRSNSMVITKFKNGYRSFTKSFF